jgi:hypothetical protein
MTLCHRRTRLFTTLCLACLCLPAQSVISAHSGLIDFWEGEIFLDDKPVERSYGRFPRIGDGSVLRTIRGRAEVLLGPSALLWMGPQSAVSMLSDGLADTRIELLDGAVVVRLMDNPLADPAVLVYRDSQIRLWKTGAYRLDTASAQLRAMSGKTEITSKGSTTLVGEGRLFSFNSGLVSPYSRNAADSLDLWAKQRGDAIAISFSEMYRSRSGERHGIRRRARAVPSFPASLPRRTW